MTEPSGGRQRMFRGKPMVRMHAMMKAAGPVCNLDCDYCYYTSKKELLTTQSRWKTTPETLERFIRQYVEQQNAPEIVFSWQGGEASLLGLDFFKTIVALQKKYTPPHVRIENDLQTNGTLLDDAWCAFLRENNFLVGLSMDGPKHMHDVYRKDASGAGSFDRVMRSARLLHEYGVRFATLTVVNAVNAKHPVDVYTFLRDEVGSSQMQFMPLVEHKAHAVIAPQRWNAAELPDEHSPRVNPSHPDSVVAPWCVPPDAYGDFLTGVFDEYLKRDLGAVYVPFFDSAVEQWMGKPSPLCIFAPICGKGVAVEHNGDVYACDHYVYPEYRLGNIAEKALIDMVLSPRQERFGYVKDSALPRKCRECRYLFACSGECPKNRLLKTAEGEAGLNYLCAGLYRYFSHIDPYIRKIVHALGHEVADDVPPLPLDKKGARST
ncbi:Anaerobic sulfatase-maturating enzyme [uncultured delta proteobacterium]|uniref:Anaerobic sulfatase-maturating enzyme n=1 Tax=uncultured delta proteobacterium TaxID=34034 RepID=A0A212JTZ3_9DELT|nr:Anaerobic sulfatase-maturating enzyme [uncultured delta proteobacterium]